MMNVEQGMMNDEGKWTRTSTSTFIIPCPTFDIKPITTVIVNSGSSFPAPLAYASRSGAGGGFVDKPFRDWPVLPIFVAPAAGNAPGRCFCQSIINPLLTH
jgi:hypothetical protein